MFNMMNWPAPKYAHVAPIDTIDKDTGNRRKLSKRYDREAAVANLWEDGWAAEPILEYLFNIIASGYEEAKTKNPSLTVWDYPINVKKLPPSGALFDMKKMEWWARAFIATLSVDELVSRVVAWAKAYSPEWTARLSGKEDYLKAMLAIERDDPKRIRKDFVTWKQTLAETSYFWDDLFEDRKHQDKGVRVDHWTDGMEVYSPFHLDQGILREFLSSFDIKDGKDSWWNKIKEIAARAGMSNGDAAMMLRVAITGRTNTPDLYSIMQVMGAHRVRERVENAIKG
jgi:glutamyl-tRNA synthetase